MKKTIVTLLAVLLVSSIALFATSPTSSDSFQVLTSIQGQNEIKVATTALSASTWSGATGTVEAVISDGQVGSFTQVAFLNTRTNNRAGYSIAITADKLDSDGFELNYAVQAMDITTGTTVVASFDTASSSNASNVIEVGESITGLTFHAYPLQVKIDLNDYQNMPSGDYQGTVYFNYTAK